MIDDNEGACGACRRVGELICCDGCPAAFHCRCAGYATPDDVPPGDWYCWFCAKDKKSGYQHPTVPFRAPRASNYHVMLAADETAETFYRTKPLAISEGYIELQYMDVEHDNEIVHRNSVRLWHGTTDKNAWAIEDDGVTWRPHCRLLQVDTEALAEMAAASPTHAAAGQRHQHGHGLQQQQQQRQQRSQPLPADALQPAAGVVTMVRVPAGEIGAGLPVVVGGADAGAFNAALHSVWRSRLGENYLARMPQCLLMSGQQVEPWQLWREVWAWGGPEVVSKNKLWATVGFSFNTPATCTSVSSRIKRSYDHLLAPLDQAIDDGLVVLQRPDRTREPRHRALQIRVNQAPDSTSGGASVRRNRQPGGGGSSSRAMRRSGSSKRKRKRGRWSSSDEEEPAAHGPDSEFSEEYSGSEEFEEGVSGAEEGQEEEEDSEEEEEAAGAASPPKLARTVASSRAAVAAAAATAARVSVGSVKRDPEEAIARPVVTPAAQQIKVGQAVDFRRWQQPALQPGSASGWRSGTVLDIEPGSIWEGGRRFLIKPRHHHNSSSSNGAAIKSQASSMLKPPLDSPAAAAMAAVAAAGLAAAGEAGAEAAQKLLTKAGHLRHEVAGLMSLPGYRPGSPGPSRLAASSSVAEGGNEATPAGGRQQPAGAGAAGVDQGSGDDDDAPTWVPLLWRGTAQQPFATPVVLVRPHYSPAATVEPPAAAGHMQSSESSPFFKQQQQQQQGLRSKLAAGVRVEVFRSNSWWPAQVLSVKEGDGGPAAAAPASSGPSSSVSGAVFAAGASCVVLLQNLEPPEADGQVWRCSSGHAMRPAHPQHTSGYGVLAARQDDLMPLSQLRKQIAPYTYAGGIQAYACLNHLKDTRRG